MNLNLPCCEGLQPIYDHVEEDAHSVTKGFISRQTDTINVIYYYKEVATGTNIKRGKSVSPIKDQTRGGAGGTSDYVQALCLIVLTTTYKIPDQDLYIVFLIC